MPRDTILLVQRATDDRSVAATHAQRLRERQVADAVRVATYESEPVAELAPDLEAIGADRLFVVPLCLSHSNETIDAIPAALSRADAQVSYCEPVGRSPALTRAIVDRATDRVADERGGSLVLVGFGASNTPYNRQTVEFHATRARERSGYDEVVTCYVLQNPAVECVRYNVGEGPTVAVPLFVTPSRATTADIPSKLELDRGGIEYADVLGTHPLVTDAVEAEVAKQRVLGDDEADQPTSFEATLTATARPLATDGDGGPV